MTTNQIRDIVILLCGFLSGLKLFLSAFGINIPNDAIEGLVNMIAFGTAIYAVWKNTYISKKAKRQKAVLRQYYKEWAEEWKDQKDGD